MARTKATDTEVATEGATEGAAVGATRCRYCCGEGHSGRACDNRYIQDIQNGIVLGERYVESRAAHFPNSDDYDNLVDRLQDLRYFFYSVGLLTEYYDTTG